MKKCLFLILFFPLILSSQEISIRALPLYLGFYGYDYPYLGSSLGIDYYINESECIGTNIGIKSIDLSDNTAVVYTIKSGLKKFTKKHYFIAYNIKLCIWDENNSEYWDNDTIYSYQDNRASIGPEISFGKRIYFSSYNRFFLEFDLSVGGGGYIQTSTSKREIIKDNLITRIRENDVGLYLSPGFIIQIGYKF